MKKIKLPNPVILVVGSMGAFWIADIVNPGFNPIGVMILFLIPVLIAEFLYPQPELEQLLEQQLEMKTKAESDDEPVAEEVISGDLLDEEPET